VSLLHTGSETGRNESKQFFHGTWKAACETRTYKLEDGTRVLVTVFMADFIEGMGARAVAGDPLPVMGAYQYSVEIRPAEAYQRPVTTEYGDLDESRLTPTIPGETRTLLAWEAALDEAETLLQPAPPPPDLGELQERTLTLSRGAWEQMVAHLHWLVPETGAKDATERINAALAAGEAGPLTVTVALVGKWGWEFVRDMSTDPDLRRNDEIRSAWTELVQAIDGESQ